MGDPRENTVEHHDVLPTGYDADDAAEDQRNLATLSDPTVPWRTRRRLRHRVGDAEELATRLVAYEELLAERRVSAPDAVRILEADAVALAREYHEVCSQLYGRGDPDVVVNARRIASGEVPPWEARKAITAERERLARQHSTT